jgi:hypothetical protein
MCIRTTQKIDHSQSIWGTQCPPFCILFYSMTSRQRWKYDIIIDHKDTDCSFVKWINSAMWILTGVKLFWTW